MTLYYKPTCPFCRRVLAVIDRLELEVELKDVSADESLKEELQTQGGKLQVPYFVDTEHNVAVYESDDIVAHLQSAYGETKAPARARVHISDATCVSCEG